MKKDIHPQYHSDAKTVCSCGAVLEAGATKKEMRVEICSQCHPFYTGKKKIVDTTGRVDRFKKLTEKTVAKHEAERKARAEKKTKEEEKKTIKKKAIKKNTSKKK